MCASCSGRRLGVSPPRLSFSKFGQGEAVRDGDVGPQRAGGEQPQCAIEECSRSVPTIPGTGSTSTPWQNVPTTSSSLSSMAAKSTGVIPITPTRCTTPRLARSGGESERWSAAHGLDHHGVAVDQHRTVALADHRRPARSSFNQQQRPPTHATPLHRDVGSRHGRVGRDAARKPEQRPSCRAHRLPGAEAGRPQCRGAQGMHVGTAEIEQNDNTGTASSRRELTVRTTAAPPSRRSASALAGSGPSWAWRHESGPLESPSRAHLPDVMNSATFSPIITQVRWVLALVMFGITEASTTRRFSTPLTRQY